MPAHLRTQAIHVCRRLLFAFALSYGSIAAAQPAQDASFASATKEIAVGSELPGAFYQKPDGEGPFPAIVVLGGSEGGDSSARRKAPLFLAQGYAVLGLPYYSPAYYGREAQFPALPAAFHDIPLESLGTSLEWLRERPEVDGSKIAAYGVSKGAEFVLAGASRIDGFAAVIAIVPSDVIWEAWGPGTTDGESSGFSWHGEPLPFVPYIGMDEEIAKYGRAGATPRLRTPQDAGRHANPELIQAARIKVEDIDAPVLVAGGDMDNTWASGEMAQQIAERRAAAGLSTVSLIFPDAGHGLSGTGEQNTQGDFRYAEADLAAQSMVWSATLAFLAEHLKNATAIKYPANAAVVRASGAFKKDRVSN